MKDLPGDEICKCVHYGWARSFSMSDFFGFRREA